MLAKNFGVSEAAFANLPKNVEKTRWIFPGKVPGPLASDAVVSPAGFVPESFTYRFSAQKPIKVAGGQVRIVDSTNFPAASTIAGALVEVNRAVCASCTGTEHGRVAVLHQWAKAA